MTTAKLAWKGATPFNYDVRCFTDLSPDEISPGGDYSMANVRLLCLACQLLRVDVPIGNWQAALGRLSARPMPEVHSGFLVSHPNGKTAFEEEWRKSAEHTASSLLRSLESISAKGQQKPVKWRQQQQQDGQRQRQ
jgi:hypothetical protein